MPELPEVETVKKILNKVIVGAKITDVIIHKENIITGDPHTFKKTLIGENFSEVKLIGK